jgi:signal transduction histidine kinase
MLRKIIIGVLTTTALMFTTTAFAAGTASEAKAMLEKAVAAIKADKSKALDEINKGENGFLVGDLYPFCFDAGDGKLVAIGSSNPKVRAQLGSDARNTKDANGKAFGKELFDAAQKPTGEISEVNYMWPKPGNDPTPAAKVSFVTRVEDLGCGVGYYK